MADQTAKPDDSPAYQLEKPTVATARAALQGYYGPHCDDLWHTLLARAGIRTEAEESDPTAFGRLVSAMQVSEPMARLCARGLAVRGAAYERLVARR
jgi:hypothetical protein